MDLTHWPDAEANGARLITGARVNQITTNARGRASGAVYVDRQGELIGVQHWFRCGYERGSVLARRRGTEGKEGILLAK